MSKILISMTDPIHCLTCRVLYGDTDAGGVVYYAGYLRFFETGRTEFMREYIYSYKRMEDEGIILPVVECFTRYKAPAVYDDLLKVETSLAYVKEISCRFNYRIMREADNRLLVFGYTVHAAVDRKGKLVRLPADALGRIRELGVPAEQQG